MKTLEDTLRALAKRGELNALSLTFSSEKKFVACYSMGSRCHNTFAADSDPVKAIAMAIKPKRERDHTDEYDFG